jgi:tRNA (adenine57-N1/adenine58-N1)-methyltransferase catalytic subunit
VGTVGHSAAVRQAFEVGERVLLVDDKKRHYLVTLAGGGQFHTHHGYVAHDDLIGASEGGRVTSTRNEHYRALRPTMEDVILLMPRGAQVIYPKDIGPIVHLADIYPGSRVFESGVGSGALSMAMLRSGAEIVGYEIREDFANRARTNVIAVLGDGVVGRYQVHLADAYAGIDPAHLAGGRVDRAVLDLPEPWQVIPHVEQVLEPGGVLCCYTPSIVQASQVRERLGQGSWTECKTIEVLHRSWHVDGLAVRPDHRMVAHTAFLTFARLVVD